MLGRTDDPHAVEEAVWERERSHSTGFCKGFAIPHCKSAAVRTHSLVALKSRAPLQWDTLDEQPVHLVILLAVGDADSGNNHLKVLAKLARLLVDEAFRELVDKETDPQALRDFLAESIQV